ncbi:MAG: hypothetical protein ABIJ56_04190 [Pseudomonadota bacterium]
MALAKKIGRIARLAGLIGLSVGSMILSACGAKEKAPGQVPDRTAGPAKEAGHDTGTDDDADSKDPRENRRRITAPDDAGSDPDTDLWNIICE